MSEFSPECLRIAQLYERDPDAVAYYMELHGVTTLPACRSPFDGYGPFISDLTAIVNNEPSRTKQEFTQMSDPNWIIDRHAAGQDVTMFLNPAQAMTGDFTDSPKSLQDVLNTSIAARRSFAELPADLRSKFGNNPITFIDFITDPRNADKLPELGLVQKPSVAEATSPAAVPSPAAAKEGGGEGA